MFYEGVHDHETGAEHRALISVTSLEQVLRSLSAITNANVLLLLLLQVSLYLMLSSHTGVGFLRGSEGHTSSVTAQVNGTMWPVSANLSRASVHGSRAFHNVYTVRDNR